MANIEISSQQSINLELTGQTGGVNSIEITPGGLVDNQAVTVEVSNIFTPNFTIEGIATNVSVSQDVVFVGDTTLLESRVAAVENTVTNFVNKKPTVPVVTNSGGDVVSSISGNVLTSATDPDGNVLTVTGCSYGSTSFSTGATFSAPYGNIVISSNGSYSFN